MPLLPGDSASYLGVGPAADMPTPPSNYASYTVARYYQNDTQLMCDWVGGVWICTKLSPGPPPPSPGPGLNQWACNAAGYIVYSVIYKLVKAAVDSNFFSLALNAIIAFAFDAIAAMFPESIIIDGSLLTWLENWVATAVQPYLTTFLATILDQAFWNKVHCYLYTALVDTPSDIQAALVAAATALDASTLSPTNVVNGIVLLLEHFGIYNIGPIPLSGFVKQYNCSECSSTGVATGPGILQTDFDLTVTDGTNTVALASTIKVIGANVSGTSPQAIITIPSGELTVTDGVTAVADVATIAFSIAGSVSSPSAGEALVTFPPMLELTDGTHDVLSVGKITVSGATVGGTSPNATLTIPVATIGVDDGVHHLSGISELTFSGATVSAGGAGDAIVTVTYQGWELTDGTHDLLAVAKVTVSGATVGGTPTAATLTIPVASITVSDGSHTLASITQLTFANNVTVSTGGTGIAVATITFPGTLELTDGTHDLTGVTKITVFNLTVGGTAGAATLTGGATLELTDGTHDLTAVSKISTSSLVVGGTSAAATLDLPTAVKTLELVQWGYAALLIPVGSFYTSLTVTYPTAFVTPPLVMVSGQNKVLTHTVDSVGKTTCVITIAAAEPVLAATGSFVIWLALPDPTGNFVGPSHAISGGGFSAGFTTHAIQGGGSSDTLNTHAIQGGGFSDAQITTLTSPANGATGVSPTATFSWGTIPGASTYRIQISTSAAFSTTAVNATTSATSYTPTAGALSVGNTYYWRVRMETGVVGSYSSVSSFST